MVIEIERKFLVANDMWRVGARPGVHFRQGYLPKTAIDTVRIRCSELEASVTIKSPRRGLTRQEHSYAIPLTEGEDLLRLCPGLVDKVRHLVTHQGDVWDIDVYLGAASGLVVAEIELEHEEQPFSLPPWLGAEISYDSRYRNSAIAVNGAPPREVPPPVATWTIRPPSAERAPPPLAL